MTDEAALAALERAGELIRRRRFVDALEPAAMACRLCPASAAAWRSYGVALKHARRWADCLAACEAAIDLDPGDCEGPRRNAGIAATALGDWPRARRAWTEAGLEVPDGEGPLEMALGLACVRIAPDRAPEVVSCERLDPCRARIDSVPVPECGRGYGDVLLHDGEPRGQRWADGVEVPVFDELVVHRRSDYGTWQVTAECRGPAERDALIAMFDGIDGAIEDWTEALMMLCAECSLGTPHHHEARREPPWQVARDFGVALRNERELDRLRRLGLWWRRDILGVTRVR